MSLKRLDNSFDSCLYSYAKRIRMVENADLTQRSVGRLKVTKAGVPTVFLHCESYFAYT